MSLEIYIRYSDCSQLEGFASRLVAQIETTRPAETGFKARGLSRGRADPELVQCSALNLLAQALKPKPQKP